MVNEAEEEGVRQSGAEGAKSNVGMWLQQDPVEKEGHPIWKTARKS